MVRPQLNTPAQPEAHCKCNLQLGVRGEESHWFVGFVKLAVVTPHLSFSSSVACLLPK